ncbi:NEW3 domain-containing protein [Paenibacillus sedimenti]|uniref:PIG-L family deacetylase n=1 Tax=Paenibacillus sedimenti TaxID=2770274 RepID=A0A926KUM4_9BACL|nr:NEW3 domain-containing protein [Paenibacillus sedimenti]MBD0384454.1 PIG-L family deacetylase [Paenibacillus sedimenti]
MKKGTLRKVFTSVTSIAVLGSLMLPGMSQPASADRGVVDLWKSIKPLTTIASAMNTGAHPDDEHSAMLAYLSIGRGVNTSSIIANRGEGGQNEIGSELGNALGIIRSRELQEASKITNVTLGMLSEQIDDPIFDFGFSKSPDETLEKWGDSVVYERLIRKIRELRPDVVIPAFLNEESTHGHHRAINVITVRAYKDAADPKVFPEHMKKGLQPWQIKKMYVPANEKDYNVAVPVGDYDEIYGASYVQLGEESRFMHKSQGMGRHVEEGSSFNYYKLNSSAKSVKETDFFDGIAFTFEDLAKEIEAKGKDQKVIKDLRNLNKDADEVVKAYPVFADVAREVQEMKADVEAAISDVKASTLDASVKTDLLYRLQVKEDQLNKAGLEATSMVVKVKPETSEIVAGQTVKMTVTVYNGGKSNLKNIQLQLNVPEGWTAKAAGTTKFDQLSYNQTVSAAYEVQIPQNAAEFQVYQPSVVSADVMYQLEGVSGKIRVTPTTQVAVLPAFAMSLSPDATVLNTLKTEEPLPVKVTVRNYSPGAAKTSVALNVPQGWTVTPASQELSFAAKGETKPLTFQVKAPAGTAVGKYTVAAAATSGSVTSKENVQVIEYPHIGRTYLIQPAELKIQALDLQVPTGLKVGYVSSGFDNIDKYLTQFGVNVTQLDTKAIQSADLSQYDTIVLGIRAYGFRPELLSSNQRLLSYVENGGNLVVQYHKPEDKWKPELAPYPITIGTPLIKWRVTDENSKVTMLAPDHPIFTTPNKITAEDWNNWIQDRSAYNPSVWGKEYTELISNGDAGEKEFTGTFLSAKYGKGTYTYSSLVWYREIPNLVPGSIRLFVNMISLKQ